MKSKAILAHAKRERTVEMSAAELERHRAQTREDDVPKQAPRPRTTVGRSAIPGGGLRVALHRRARKQKEA
jgi:hypothetical protein